MDREGTRPALALLLAMAMPTLPTEEDHDDRDLSALLERERRARRRLAALSATKDAVLAVIADETRATLSCVAEWMRVLGSQHLDSQTRRCAVAAIEGAARKELELLDDLLDIARGNDEPTTPLALDSVDLDIILGGAVDLVATNENDVRIDTAGIGDAAALVLGDPTKLARVFERFVALCVKHTRPGGTVKLALRREPDAWCVRIEMPAREDVALESHPDSCVDLALARAVISAHRGRFDGIEDIRRGTRVFVVSLPAIVT